MSVEVHYQSVETLYLPVLKEHPGTGPVILSGQTVEVAMPTSGAAPSTWVTTTWASGTLRRGDDRWYLAELDLSDFSLSAGSTYQPWVRIGGAGGALVKASDTIKAINT